MDESKFHIEVYETIEVYEGAIGNFATRTRQMIEDHGAIEALARLVQSADLQKGFKVLRDRGELQLTFEALVTKYPNLFRKDVVAAAQWRMDNANDLL